MILESSIISLGYMAIVLEGMLMGLTESAMGIIVYLVSLC